MNPVPPLRGQLNRPSATIFLVVLLSFWGLAAYAQGPPDLEALRERAILLYQQNNFVDAVPLLERLAEAQPHDADILELLGYSVYASSATLTDPEEHRQQRLRARQILLRARDAGSDSEFLLYLLETIPEDGSRTAFSERKDVDQAVKEGEAAFARGDFDGALAAYKQALALDPTHYEAALFIGDVYYKQQLMDRAGEWFAIAVRNNPNRETAYRYWGDALLWDGQLEEARSKFIQAIIAEPYNRATWMGLLKWAQRDGARLVHPRLESPNRIQEEEGNTTIVLDANTLDKKDGTESWMAYEISRAAWKAGLFAKHFPEETEYRHTLKEEADALRTVADVVRTKLEEGKIESLDPALAVLLELEAKDLIEAYVLLARADEGIARDYAAYAAQNHAKLRRYLEEHVISYDIPARE